MKVIIVDITDDGEIHLETQGFEGSSCIEETEFIKQLLGKEMAKKLTPAYFNQNTQVIRKYLQLCG